MSDYYEELFDEEWKKKRTEILQRDNHRCKICGRTRTFPIECPEEPSRPKQEFHVGLNYSDSVAVCNDACAICDKKTLSSGIVSLYGGKAQTFVLDNGLRHVLIGRTYIVPTTIESKEELQAEDIMYGIATCSDGTLCPIMFRAEDVSFAPFLHNKIERPYRSDHAVELHVHHKYYILGRKPWEYPNDCLITLCSDCHEKLHHDGIVDIPIYTIDSNGRHIKMEYTPCNRCNGLGYIKEYLYYKGGICFRCNGAKYEELIERTKKLGAI